jgi:hypothetical protein
VSGEVGFDQLIGLWEDGSRRLRELDGPDRRAIERVIEEIVSELTRRLGQTFTTEDLARCYLEIGTDWCFELATRIAPGNPAAWDMTTAAGAAFAWFARRAGDYGGGRRIQPEAEED